MKIGINGQRLLVDNPAGPEVYTYNIVKALANIDRENEYVVYFSQELREGYFDALTSGNINFKYKVLPNFPSWTQFHLALELIRNPVDVFFTPVHTMPIVRSIKIKVVSMIHGLEYLSNQVRGLKLIQGAPVRFVAEKSDYLIVPSTYTKEALCGTSWDVQKEKIEVIPEGVSATFYKRQNQDVVRILNKYGLEDQTYLISVSTVQPRKNYPRLIEAFSRLSEHSGKLKLVICGKKGWGFEESFDAPKKYGIEDKVVFLGRVSDEDLPYLLSGAVMFVSASLEEGFGLPLLEAMACETYCAVSDIPPFRSISADTSTFFDPLDVTEMTKKLEDSYSYVVAGNAKAKIVAAKSRSMDFSWEKAAEKTLRVFTNLC